MINTVSNSHGKKAVAAEHNTSTSTIIPPPAAAQLTMSHLTLHEAISNAAIRKARALDNNDATLLASVFAEDATYDLTGFDFLKAFGILQGRDSIVANILEAVGKLDTTHMLSNFSTGVAQDGKTAQLSCYSLAQHWRPGEGKPPSCRESFLMGNQWEGNLIFDGELWRFEHFGTKCFWTQGEFAVFAGSDSE